MVCGQARTEGEREESDGDISEDDGDEDDDDDIPYNPKVNSCSSDTIYLTFNHLWLSLSYWHASLNRHLSSP